MIKNILKKLIFNQKEIKINNVSKQSFTFNFYHNLNHWYVMAINYQILYYNLPKKNIYYNTFPKTPLQVTHLLKEIFAGDIPFSMN